MLDDFDVLDAYQQSRVFETMSTRLFSTVCFKLGIMILGKKAFLSSPGRTLRPGDDYDYIDLDWTQGGLHHNYKDAVLEIAKARLKEARLKDRNWPVELEDLLPDWEHGKSIWKEVVAEMKRRWEAELRKPGFQTLLKSLDREDLPLPVKGNIPSKGLRPARKETPQSQYISKYGNALFFQLLRQRKIRMRYSGLEYVVMVSSGVFRQFLEVCKLIFDRAHDKGWSPKLGGVAPEVQDDAMREYSGQMMQQFTRTSGYSQDLLSGDLDVTSKHMITLIESLCNLFYDRLHIHDHREPEILCIAVRDDLSHNPRADTYLKIAVRESILHRLEYPPKVAGGPPLEAFMLNRRLGPRRDLSIRRMQGRIEVECQDIILAVTDAEKFKQRMLRQSTDFSPEQQRLGTSQNKPN